MLRAPLRAAPLLLVVAFAAACGGTSPPPPASPPDATYSVNAEIVRLPGTLGGDLELRHESIPDFRDRSGRSSPMMSMTMQFEVAPELDLSELVPGDRVRATFEVRWSADDPLRVTGLVLLPEETRLEFDPEEESGELPGADFGDDGS